MYLICPMVYLKKVMLAHLKKDIDSYNKSHDDDHNYMRACMHLSKKSIVASHNGKLSEAAAYAAKLAKKWQQYRKRTHTDPFVFKMIAQEWVETELLLAFLTGKALPDHHMLKVNADAYFLGMCDLSGELVRYALDAALRQDKKEVQRVKSMLDELYNAVQCFIVRGEMRKKADRLRWDLERIAHVLVGMNHGQ